MNWRFFYGLIVVSLVEVFFYIGLNGLFWGGNRLVGRGDMDDVVNVGKGRVGSVLFCGVVGMVVCCVDLCGYCGWLCLVKFGCVYGVAG